ncbi:hypothetical protein T492DRAFT_1018780 [Pavlovales sp. CCMP2436]|nr:hypothetical protein T492DRAFT_1018780 [Pavlovales sp. CCMP2436]
MQRTASTSALASPPAAAVYSQMRKAYSFTTLPDLDLAQCSCIVITLRPVAKPSQPSAPRLRPLGIDAHCEMAMELLDLGENFLEFLDAQPAPAPPRAPKLGPLLAKGPDELFVLPRAFLMSQCCPPKLGPLLAKGPDELLVLPGAFLMSQRCPPGTTPRAKGRVARTRRARTSPLGSQLTHDRLGPILTAARIAPPPIEV